MRSPDRCPNCGERVSAFAAGCALCGAELNARRAHGPRSLTDRVRVAMTTLKAPPRPVPRERRRLH
jgi:predicted  nucleic acid-binding Zn-ribbon protein